MNEIEKLRKLIDEKIVELDEKDVEGHVWYMKFIKLINSVTPPEGTKEEAWEAWKWKCQVIFGKDGFSEEKQKQFFELYWQSRLRELEGGGE